jgi:acetyl esterase/lipase
MKRQILSLMREHRRTAWLVGVACVAILAVGWLAASGQSISDSSHRLQDHGRRAIARVSISITMASVAHTVRDINYCGTTNHDQQLDLYEPKHAVGPYPVVVFIHGGGWWGGNKADPIVSTYGPMLVKQGIALASINYRLAPRYTYPTQDQDVSCALSYLYSNANRYSLDNSRFGLFGASAGGQLAAYAALATASRNQPWYPSLRGVVDFYGVANLTNVRPHSYLSHSIARFLGPGNNPTEQAAASPITYATQPAPPMLLFHGTRDRHVPLTQSQQLVQTLQASGNSATLVVVQHAGHGFGWGNQPSVSQIRQQLTNFFTHAFSHSA